MPGVPEGQQGSGHQRVCAALRPPSPRVSGSRRRNAVLLDAERRRSPDCASALRGARRAHGGDEIMVATDFYEHAERLRSYGRLARVFELGRWAAFALRSAKGERMTDTDPQREGETLQT